jgi:signal transduction histidine kinase
MRQVDGQRVVLDDDTSGRIIGLLSLIERGRAFFTCQAATEVTAVCLPWAQLDAVVAVNPELSRQLTRQLIHSLSARVRRVVDLQASVQRLNAELLGERDRLAEALRQLSATQMRLIETGRMATVGQLVAGIAHELNNPVTAIRRAADYVLEDVSSLIGQMPDNEPILAMITSAVTTSPQPTEALRRAEQALADAIRDEGAARRLVKIGITSADEFHRWFDRVRPPEREALLSRLESAYQLGTFLRNLQGGAERISQIVSTLRSYARTSHGAVGAVDLNKTLEDTLLLFGGSARLVELRRDYGDLPPIEGDPGQLCQVWTNIVANALEAIQGRGSVLVQSDAAADGSVRVRITDDGPGIPAGHIERVFDLNFTTKHNPTSFGLGMGLVICRQIVLRHEGRIEVESVPGRTCFTITLPTRLSADARRAIEESARGIVEPRSAGS